MTRSSAQSFSFEGPGLVASPYVCLLERAEDRSEVGGKAHNLGRMARLGLRVPLGFAVTRAALDGVLRHNHLETAIHELTQGIDLGDRESRERASGAIRELLLAAAIPAEILDSILAARAALLPDAPLIIRSSAVGEDGAASSFAGQLDSIAGVRSDQELERALCACWSSRWSARCLFYQSSRGAPLLGMGVVVQELIPSAIAGVLFTEAPGGPSNGDLLCEYCYGHGEALVSGAINPGSVLLPRDGGPARRIAAPEQDTEVAMRGADLLTDGRLRELSRAGLLLEADFAAPQDIEWTIHADGRLFLVQSRPITARASAAAPPAAAKAPDAQPSVTWSNANVNENFPSPVSPLLYSVASAGYSHYFLNLARAYGISERRIRAMEGPLRTIIGVHGARIYYNLTNIHAFISIAPFGDALADYFNQYVGAASPSGGGGRERPRTARWGARAIDFAELAVVASTTTLQYTRIEEKIRDFEATIDAYAERTRPDRLASRSLEDLLGDLRAFVDIRCNRWANASLADAAAAVCYGLLRQVLREALPGEDQGAAHNNLLKGLSDVVSSEPAVDIWGLSRAVRADAELKALLFHHGGRAVIEAMNGESARFPAFRASLERALSSWGFRGSGELMLTEPSFQEDPAALLDIVRAYAVVDGPSPAEVMKEREHERAAETKRVIELLQDPTSKSRIPRLVRARALSLLLSWTQRAIALRERARLKQALLYSRLRRVALSIGDKLSARGVLDRSDDIFFLTHQEIDAILSGAAMFPYRVRSLIALRRDEHEELSKMAPPDVVTLPLGDYLHRAPAASPPQERTDAVAPREPQEELFGAGTCGGRAVARAAVLRDMSEAHLLAAGDALVTRQTDPGWGPVFFLIKGLVMERGGMLSHGAIIAREFGIPAVVGVRGATRLIGTGDTLVIDGDRGSVRLSRAASSDAQSTALAGGPRSEVP